MGLPAACEEEDTPHTEGNSRIESEKMIRLLCCRNQKKKIKSLVKCIMNVVYNT